MKKGIVLIALICLFLLLPVNVTADSVSDGNSNAIYEARNGILQVNLVFVDETGECNIVQGASGFLIGNEEGAEYLITNYHCLNVTEELRSSVAEEYGLAEEEADKLQFTVKVVVKRDISIDATVVTASEEMDFAVLQLSQIIYDRTPLQLNVEEESIVETTQVYTLGFPEDIQVAQDISFYTKDDVSVMNGIVSKKTMVNGILYVQHSAVVSEGNSGGPLLNEVGAVVGMNQQIMDDGYYYSVHISEITSVLDALGIPYTVCEEEKAEVVDRSVLEAAVKAAEEKNTDGYTKESIEIFQAAIENARLLLEKEVLTQEELDKGLLELKAAEAALCIEGNSSYLLIGGIVILLLLITVVVLLILIVRKGDKGTEKEASPRTSKLVLEKRQLQLPGIMEETGVLHQVVPSGNAGETTVLGSDFCKDLVTATLIRCKTDENITINKNTFYLGKESLKVDYCVKNNPSVSRSHAAIRQTNGGFYLEDLQATNGTFLNGTRLKSGQSVKLTSGDRIRLANEEFCFRI